MMSLQNKDHNPHGSDKRIILYARYNLRKIACLCTARGDSFSCGLLTIYLIQQDSGYFW